LIDSAKFLRDYHFDNDKSIVLIATSNSKKHKELQDQINPIFNYFESISIGVRIGNIVIIKKPAIDVLAFELKNINKSWMLISIRNKSYF
jgi:hypothetical protein